MKIKSITYVALFCMMGAAACTGSGSKAAGDSTAKDSNPAPADTAKSMALKPKGAAPAWAPDIKPEMQAVIEKLVSYGDKPIPELTAVEARKNHTPTDAVMDLMKENNIPKSVFNVDTMGKDIPVEGGSIHARIYMPKTGKASYPVIVYYHGGGFVIANLDVYGASANVLADKTDAIVVSVAYRLAPEYKFPTAHNDAFAAYKWVLANAAGMKGDAKKVAVVGESAGGNLAINTAIKARDSKIMVPTAIVAVYPVAGADMTTASYIKNAAAKPLNKPMMMWFVKNYLNNMAEGKDPRINLIAANLKGLPPTTVITDEIDPLQSEGMALVEKLKAAGVTVDSKNWDGVTHEFFGMGAVVPQAKEAEMYAVDQLKKAFGM
ncbi:alpha/beta hydrolase [Mucilaginibacter sp. RB4R14]|uniref:alpha/beta hydrolase n=1 Tax=Mucilaginibacter aurantiaciroseus TaxID=2949308 RepID=UPI00209029F1|nr:alpha/beta hydrolase [Mucilaginibacter aurantiaciroseus]MCO5935942.1 alpha/beta hydrolase [Mucilaginibacter aurantiaciroseus]